MAMAPARTNRRTGVPQTDIDFVLNALTGVKDGDTFPVGIFDRAESVLKRATIAQLYKLLPQWVEIVSSYCKLAADNADNADRITLLDIACQEYLIWSRWFVCDGLDKILKDRDLILPETGKNPFECYGDIGAQMFHLVAKAVYLLALKNRDIFPMHNRAQKLLENIQSNAPCVSLSRIAVDHRHGRAKLRLYGEDTDDIRPAVKDYINRFLAACVKHPLDEIMYKKAGSILLAYKVGQKLAVDDAEKNHLRRVMLAILKKLINAPLQVLVNQFIDSATATHPATNQRCLRRIKQWYDNLARLQPLVEAHRKAEGAVKSHAVAVALLEAKLFIISQALTTKKALGDAWGCYVPTSASLERESLVNDGLVSRYEAGTGNTCYNEDFRELLRAIADCKTPEALYALVERIEHLVAAYHLETHNLLLSTDEHRKYRNFYNSTLLLVLLFRNTCPDMQLRHVPAVLRDKLRENPRWRGLAYDHGMGVIIEYCREKAATAASGKSSGGRGDLAAAGAGASAPAPHADVPRVYSTQSDQNYLCLFTTKWVEKDFPLPCRDNVPREPKPVSKTRAKRKAIFYEGVPYNPYDGSSLARCYNTMTLDRICYYLFFKPIVWLILDGGDAGKIKPVSTLLAYIRAGAHTDNAIYEYLCLKLRVQERDCNKPGWQFFTDFLGALRPSNAQYTSNITATRERIHKMLTDRAHLDDRTRFSLPKPESAAVALVVSVAENADGGDEDGYSTDSSNHIYD